jgi:hypothetical protein
MSNAWKTKPISQLRGRHVVLLQDIQTRGGTQFERGRELVIVAKYRGLELAQLDRPTAGVITRVGYDQVRLLDE